MAFAAILGLLFLLAIVVPLPIGIVMIVRSGKGRLAYPSCGQCGYDLTGFTTESDSCPECGGKYTEVGIIPPQPGRRKGMMRWGIAMIAVPVLLIGFVVTSVLVTRAALNAATQQQQKAMIVAQQMQAAMLQQQAMTLNAEIAAVQAEREQAQSEDDIASLDATLAELSKQLEESEKELDLLSQQQGGD